MAQIEIKLPKMGESVTEATITNWLKEVGDHIALDEPLVEVATDKVDNELPSEAEGILIKKMFDKDQVAQVGDVIAVISTGGIEEKIDLVQQEVITIVNEAVQTKQAFTSQEKYNRLTEKNPNLELLRKTFDLDL